MATTKNIYYRSHLQRENLLKNFILDIFITLASYPRLLLEVFIRKDFGIRYFRLSSVVTVTVFLAFLPFVFRKVSGGFDDEESPFLWSPYIAWYIFLALFVIFSIIRELEIKRTAALFDFKKYSLYSGTFSPFFEKMALFGKPATRRQIEIFLEPLPFLIAGVVLYFIGQKLGLVLIVSSVSYSLSYLGTYQDADNYILDKIDEIIVNNAFEKDFVEGAENAETDGFRFPGRKPVDTELRKKILPLLMEQETGTVRVR